MVWCRQPHSRQLADHGELDVDWFDLRAQRAAGIRVEIDGDDLVLEAPVPPPPIVLDLLSRHKTNVIS